MITILGLGFVGLTTGLGFAKKGFKTFGIDINKERLAKLKDLQIPFHEPHLKEVLEETYKKTFHLDVQLEEAVKQSEVIFLCVGTPGAPDGSADLTYLLDGIKQILDVEDDKYKVIVIKSTVPPSTISKRVIPYLKQYSDKLGKTIGIASNPEFLREGYCWEDFIEPDRIVIGVEEDRSKEILNRIYAPFNAPIHYVSYNTAEFIKYLSNSFLSTLISYSNEMSMLADAIGSIDVAKSFRILHEDKRWFGAPASMSKYVYPGCGYGGYCLPKDTSALHSIAKTHGYEANMLEKNLETNDRVKDFVAKKITSSVKPSANIGILGLSFKSNSDDVRLTPTKDIIDRLISKGYTNIYAYDPLANEVFQEEYPHLKLTYCNSLEEAVQKSDALVILTGWAEFVEKKELIHSKQVFDYRYIY